MNSYLTARSPEMSLKTEATHVGLMTTQARASLGPWGLGGTEVPSQPWTTYLHLFYVRQNSNSLLRKHCDFDLHYLQPELKSYLLRTGTVCI